MRHLLIALSLVLLAVAVPHRAYSQSADTSDLFLNAYMANEQGEQLENSGDSEKALSKFKYAASLLDQISHDDPSWQPIVVDYRKKKVAENIARIEQQAGPQSTAAASASVPIEGELPEKENNTNLGGPPEQTAPPAATSIPTASQGVRDELDELQSELRESRQKLKAVEDQKVDLAGRLDDALKQLDRTKVSEVELKGELKQAQDAYQNSLTDHAATSGSQKDLQARVSQLEDALKNAEADRDAAIEQSDEDARRAAKARDTSEADLKQQLQQAQDALAGRAPATGQAKDLVARVAQLENALKNAEADRDAADEQTQEEARRAAKAHEATEEVTQQLTAANAHAKEVESSSANASKLVSQLDAAKAQIAALTKDRDDATQHADDLDKQLADASKTAAKLADAQKQIEALESGQQQTAGTHSELAAKLADARKQIDQLTQDRDSARQQVASLDTKLASAQKEIVSVKADRDQIAAQRDQALADLGKARAAQKHVDQLLAENATLTQKLADDEKTIQNFKSGSPEKDKQIAELRKEVSDTKALLTAAQQDRDNVQSTLNDLQQQYDSTSAELTQLKANSAVNTTERKTLTDENDLLRGIVLRQLREQAKRDQAKRLVMSELSQLQVQSDTLLKNIDYLGQPVVQLTDKEKALFKDPAIDIPDADDSTMDFSFAAPKQNSPTAHEAPVDPKPAAPPASAPSEPATADNATPSPSATPMEMASRTDSDTSASTPPPMTPPEAGSPPAPAGTTTDTIGSSSSQPTTGNPMVPPDLMDDAHDAKEAFDRNQYRDAEKIYERMLTKAPNNVYILSNLGVVYFRNDKSKLAEESLQKAIAVAPEDVFSHCTLGIVYYQEKRFDDAINSLTRALAINPKYAVAHNYLGITASQKGWQEAAKKELQTAVEIDPNYADAYFNLAVVYAMEQPPDKVLAAKYYKRAIDLGAEPDAALEQLLK